MQLKPQSLVHSPTQSESHALLQQYGSRPQTHAWHAQPEQPGVDRAAQPRPPLFVQSAPHWLSHSPTQIESHAVLQQNESMPQTHDSQTHPWQPVTPLTA